MNSGYGSKFATLTLYFSEICKNEECCAKVWFEFVEMHTNPLDPYVRIKFTYSLGLPEHTSCSLNKNIRAGNT